MRAPVEDARAMIEIVIERWTGPDGTEFRWSVWRDGARIEMDGPYPEADDAEAAAVDYCAKALGRKADRVTRL